MTFIVMIALMKKEIIIKYLSSNENFILEI